MKQTLSLIALVAASPVLAEETRQLSAHEHGVGALNIAIDGNTVGMEFHAPGADIVGFEYAPESESDHAAVESALSLLETPLDLFVVPPAAGCSVVQASAELEHEEKDHDDHDEHMSEAGHEDHDEHDHEKEHDHDTEHSDDHDDHAHEDEHHTDEHEDHAHEDHEHSGEHEEHDHAGDAGHAEFHAEYTLTCDAPEELTDITFAYFDKFENAREVVVQVVTNSGAEAFEVERDAPTLDLRSLN
ncbi:zinc uptake protein ZrgA [Meridianimarinicoccus aquatilis]|uniref:DUF2796 domain-containing protein n=1 Tax=Meridianimarinicoccus aquatilis TaxID=2552766 RepID=A0A4R6B1Q9_9RHOB|nr:DUF2796 domain-containing protein [Fluviibacterium aquatile]TDL90510.1 DUF2796 domain-containing protein [Fluviibacterium aquatile]